MNDLIFFPLEDHHCDSYDVSVVEMLGVKVREYLSRREDTLKFSGLMTSDNYASEPQDVARNDCKVVPGLDLKR